MIVYSDSFDRHYANGFLRNRHLPELPLAVKCIKRYKQNYGIRVFPIDIEVRQTLSDEEATLMNRAVDKSEDYKMLNAEKDSLVAHEGFHYLNSNTFLDFLEKKEVMEKNIMESDIQKNRLLEIYKLFHAEYYDSREHAMLEIIYKYSTANQYNQAVFLIGAGHKKSIMKKIAAYEKRSEIKLNWTMYGNE